MADLARRMAGDAADTPSAFRTALRVVEAAVDVNRACWARLELLERVVGDTEFHEPPQVDEPLPARPPRVRFSLAADTWDYRDCKGEPMWEAEDTSLMQELAWGMKVDRIRFARAEARQRMRQRASAWKRLDRRDRYERRAMSRRNTAIKSFDAAWATTLSAGNTLP
ncbi:hypothetical protein [Microvirga aerophila]|uniref:Uncharacterized protein n=1 Tax=Microvirga aerophila TaxID=670291 RepID=A0A512BWI4_9HYPH|nr:hypothetical protein [Microvirga aerophila]GEO16322.1 hypothetical protein MAE02_40180 [Microvirga aerophila]